MKITAGASVPITVEPVRPFIPQAYPAAQAKKSDFLRRFDSVTLSGEAGSAEMELRSRLSQEVRSASSLGAVAALREQVQSGSFEPDPLGIARKMLLWEEAV